MDYLPTTHRNRPMLLLITLFSLCAALLALKLGSTTVSWNALWQILNGESSGVLSTVVLELRLPRLVAAFVVGGQLSPVC